MPYQAKVIVVSDLWGEVERALRDDAVALRRTTATDILDRAKQNAPKVTEALAESGYIVDPDANTYDVAVAAAQGKNDRVEILPMVPAEPDTTIIAFAVVYAAVNEFYTGEKNPGAHPYLTPAAEGERPAFEAAVQRLGGNIR